MALPKRLKTLLPETIWLILRLATEEIGLVIPEKAWIDSCPGRFGLSRDEHDVVLEFLFFVRFPRIINIEQSSIGLDHNPKADLLRGKSGRGNLVGGILRETVVKFVEGLEDHA
jgi:hypothetical protein